MTHQTCNKLLNSLITGGAIRSDRDLARELGVAPPVISKMRHGHLALGDTMRVKIMRRFGLSLKRIDELHALDKAE